MKRKIAAGIAALAGAIAMLVPAASHAAPQPLCVVINGPGGVHIQVGYSPSGPSGCRQLP